MLPDDETTYIDDRCDEAEKKGREKCLEEGASLLRKLMSDKRVDSERLFYYLLLCLSADGHVTNWEFDLISPLAAKSGLDFDTAKDMSNWIKTQDMGRMREEEVQNMSSHLRVCSKNVRDSYFRVGILLGACDGRVSEHERVFLLDIFGYDYR